MVLCNKSIMGCAVIGAGIMGRQHARVYDESEHTELMAVVDIAPEKAKAVAEEYDGVKYFTDYREMLRDTDIAAVSIALPDAAHCRPVVDALEAGKHVLVEKPLATDMNDAKLMVATAEKTGNTLMVNYSNRWAFTYTQAKESIESGKIGKPVMTYARKNDTISVPLDMIPWSENTSPVHFLSTHDIDMIRWLFGGIEAREVFARSFSGVLRGKGKDVEDAIQASVLFEGGLIATFESAWIYPDDYPTTCESRMEIVGSSGVLHIDRNSENIELCSEEGFAYPSVALSGEVDGRLEGILNLSIRHFIEAVETGRRPAADCRDAYKTAEIACAIHRSLDAGKPVKLPLD